MSWFKYFRRMNGVWYMRKSHTFIFNWRAWVSVIPSMIILGIIILPIGVIVDLVDALKKLIFDFLDMLEPHIEKMWEWAIDKREHEWDSAREKILDKNQPILEDNENES